MFGHSDDRSDVEGNGLEELKNFEVALSVGENGGVCVGCDRVTSGSKLAVGGAVEAAEFLLYGDNRLLKGGEKWRGAKVSDVNLPLFLT